MVYLLPFMVVEALNNIQHNTFPVINEERIKESPWYIVPTWTASEYCAYFSFDDFWTEKQLIRTKHTKLVEDAIGWYGGSFRNVINSAKGSDMTSVARSAVVSLGTVAIVSFYYWSCFT